MVGKLAVFHLNLPVVAAPGQLKHMDDRKCLGTDKEKQVLSPQTKFYNDIGQECVSVGCSVDLFLFNNAYIDIATLSQVILSRCSPSKCLMDFPCRCVG